MNVLRTAIDGVLIIEPKVFKDPRGYFFESFSQRDFDALVSPLTGEEVRFVQDNDSMSMRNVVRGLHFQRPPFAQSKLVRCISGRVLDVAVDIRKNSPTYGQHVAIELSGENQRQLFIPKGFAHGFSVLSDKAIFQYKCDNFYALQAEGGIYLADTSLGIDWQVPAGEMITSDKDTKYGLFADFVTPFD